MHARTLNQLRTIAVVSFFALCVPFASAGMTLDATTMQEAQTLVQQGDWDGAIAAYRAIIKDQPSNAQAQFMLGYALHASGDLDNAILQHKKAAKLPTVAAMANYNLGCAYALKGMTDQAFEALQIAVEKGVRNEAQFKNDADLISLRKDGRWDGLIASISKLDHAETAMHFWVGQWDCYAASNGALAGTNTLAFRVGKNVIHESWVSTGGQYSGESWNAYNRETNQWEQTWVDIGGVMIHLYADTDDESVEGLMFEGKSITPGKDPQLTRMHVRPIEGGRVQQTGYSSDDGGSTWTQRYDLIYVPRGEAFDQSDPSTQG